MMLRRRIIENNSFSSKYRTVEYLKSPQYKGAYINTNIIPNDNMRIYLEAESPAGVDVASFTFGCRIDSSTPPKFWLVTFQNKYQYGFGSTHNTQITSANANERYTCDFNYNASHAISVNNVSVNATLNTPYTYTLPIYIFGLNNNNTLDLVQRMAFKLYRFKIYNSYLDANPIRDFIPCVRKSDDKPGLYDMVTNEFYINSGEGEFEIPT